MFRLVGRGVHPESQARRGRFLSTFVFVDLTDDATVTQLRRLSDLVAQLVTWASTVNEAGPS